MVLGNVLFAVAAFVKNDSGFYAMSITGRLIEGVGDGMLFVMIPSITSIEFPEDNEKYQGAIGVAQGLGLIIGPLMVTGLVTPLGYCGTFLFFAGFIGLIGAIAVCLLPASIN